MKASDASLNLLAVELARLGEAIRHHAPELADAGSALVGIQRQLAAAEAPDAAEGAAGRDPSQSAATAKAKHSKAVHDRSKTKSKTKTSDSRKQLLKSLLGEVEQLTLMLVSQEVAADMTVETFREFREATIETATQRRKHLADLAFLHSLLVATQSKAGATGAAKATDADPKDTGTGTAAKDTDTANSAKTADASAGSAAKDTAAADSAAGSNSAAKAQDSPALEKTISVAIAELETMFTRCGGQIITEYSAEDQQYFEISGSGSAMRVLRPAYIATNSDGRIMVVARGAIEGKPA